MNPIFVKNETLDIVRECESPADEYIYPGMDVNRVLNEAFNVSNDVSEVTTQQIKSELNESLTEQVTIEVEVKVEPIIKVESVEPVANVIRRMNLARNIVSQFFFSSIRPKRMLKRNLNLIKSSSEDEDSTPLYTVTPKRPRYIRIKFESSDSE